jgi:hypothetical protein
MVTLVSLEGLPHTGRDKVVRHLASGVAGFAVLDVPLASTATNGGTWTCAASQANYALFASLLYKLRKVAVADPDVSLLTTPWFEHMPRHPAIWTLVASATQALVRACGVQVSAHIMVLLHASHDETFEQIVCSGNPFWNSTSLGDVQTEQIHIAQMMHDVASKHPFPCIAYTIHCPPFFEENEVVVSSIASDIHKIVQTVTTV